MKTNTFTIKLWVYVASTGDGSVTVQHFNTEEEAEAAASTDDERFCDDVFPVTLGFDLRKGALVND